MVKLAAIQSRAPNREILIIISVRENTSGNKKTQLVKSMDAMESLRPNRSTTMADRIDPGISVSIKHGSIGHLYDHRLLKIVMLVILCTAVTNLQN
jgi:hypothetical protein